MKRKRFTLVEVMIVVAMIGLIAAIAIPSFIMARRESQTKTCVENLMKIAEAKEWAVANKKNEGDAVLKKEVEKYLPGNRLPLCPSNGTYTLGKVGENPTCSVENHVLEEFPKPVKKTELPADTETSRQPRSLAEEIKTLEQRLEIQLETLTGEVKAVKSAVESLKSAVDSWEKRKKTPAETTVEKPK